MKLQFIKVNRRGKRPLYRAVIRVSEGIAYSVATYRYVLPSVGIPGWWCINWNGGGDPCSRDSRKDCEAAIRARLLATLIQFADLQLITESEETS